MPCSKTKRVALQDPTSALMHRDILLILLRRMMLLRPVPMKSEDVALESHPQMRQLSPSLIVSRGHVFKVSFCLEGSEYFTNLLNAAMAQNLCFLLQWTLWFLIQKVEFSFLLCSPLTDQSLVTLFTHLIQMDLPVLVPLSQLDKREDQLNGEIDWAQLVIMKKIAREYIKTHLKVQFAGERMNSNMKKPEEVEQSEPKNGIQKKGTLCGKETFVLPLDNKMPTTPL